MLGGRGPRDVFAQASSVVGWPEAEWPSGRDGCRAGGRRLGGRVAG
jgi:hypothetical protein